MRRWGIPVICYGAPPMTPSPLDWDKCQGGGDVATQMSKYTNSRSQDVGRHIWGLHSRTGETRVLECKNDYKESIIESVYVICNLVQYRHLCPCKPVSRPLSPTPPQSSYPYL
jgi:hypothetical protein